MPCSARTNGTSTITVHTRASSSTHPTTTPKSSSRSTHRCGEGESSAAWSTSTHGPPDRIKQAAGHRPCDEFWHRTGALLRPAAQANLKTLIDDARAAGSVRLFSVRDEFPNEWSRFRAQTPAAGERFALELPLCEEHYPFWSKGRLKSVARVDVFARSAKPAVPVTIDVFDKPDRNDATAKHDPLTKDPALGSLLAGKLTDVPSPATPADTLKLYFNDADLDDL